MTVPTDASGRAAVRAPAVGRPRVAVVVGAGGARCAAALGLWRVLVREGVPVDLLVGSSSGSVYAAALALGLTIDAGHLSALPGRHAPARLPLRALARTLAPGLFGFDDRTGLLDDGRAARGLTALFGDATFADCRVPLHVVATDLATGEPVAIREGRIEAAVRASVARPLLEPAVVIGGRLLVDGGLSDPLPVDVAAGAGCGVILTMAFDARPPRIEEVAGAIDRIATIAANALLRATSASPGSATAAGSPLAVLPIVPRLDPDGRPLDAAALSATIAAGATAMEAALPSLRQLLGGDLPDAAPGANGAAAARPVVVQPLARPPAPADGGALDVLVVDGSASRADALARTITALGHMARTVSTAAAALAAVAARPPAVMLLDPALPDGGAAALLAARAADAGRPTHAVLVLPAPVDVAAADEMVARCLELGADDYLGEPFAPALVRARLDGCAERRRLRDVERRSGGADARSRALVRELDIGRDIQAGFLPATLPVWPGWELAAAFEAARQVSGDFYDAFNFSLGLHLGVVVGDVCGKGVGASLFMALFRSLIRAVATQVVHSGMTVPGTGDERLSTALEVANAYIAEVHGDANMFATAFAASINPRSGLVRWANAGHDPALVVAAGGGIRARLAPTGPALGLVRDLRLPLSEVRLARGETLLITTDGVCEARDPDGAFFGTERLEALCAEPVASATALAARVTDAVHAFTAGAEPADDLTLLVVHRTVAAEGTGREPAREGARAAR